MAGTINYLYDPNQIVWIINEVSCDGSDVLTVETGTVIRITSATTSVSSEVEYDVKILNQSGTLPFKESDVFSSLSAAIIDYESRLT